MNGSIGKIVIILRIDISTLMDVDNKNKDILILGKKSTQG